LLLLQADVIDETVDYVKRYLDANRTGHELGVIEALPVPEVVYATESID
jgi:hypothetical protein